MGPDRPGSGPVPRVVGDGDGSEPRPTPVEGSCSLVGSCVVACQVAPLDGVEMVERDWTIWYDLRSFY